MTASFQRIYAIILRQIYLVSKSPPRLLSLVFWPTVNMVIWGFLNQYLVAETRIAGFTLSTLLGATLLNSFFERSNINTMFSFLEDVWARNIGNIMITPLRPAEMIIGYIANGFMNVVIGVGFACFVAFLLFDYSVLMLGIGLIPFLVNLVLSGWCIGMILICVIIRFGTSGEFFGWMLAFLLVPFIAIYYPVTILPPLLQYVSWALPPTYVFEALREYIASGDVNWNHMQTAFLLNLAYLSAIFAAFIYNLNRVRQIRGLLSLDAS